MKKLFKVLMVAIMMFGLAGCGQGNKDELYTIPKYNRAIIELHGGTVIDGNIEDYRFTTYDDLMEIYFEDGNTYLVHTSNVILIEEAE